MKAIGLALLQVTLASGILYGYYYLFLRNKKFHQYNRFYLLASVIVSTVIPFLNIPLYFEEAEIRSSMVLQTLQTISSPVAEKEILTPVAASTVANEPFNWNIILYAVYSLAVVVLALRTLISLRKIRNIIATYPVEELNGIHFVNTTEPGTPFSFFRWLFWNKQIELRSDKGEQIFRHEIFHIQQKHSLDIIFMEVVTAIFWINPFFHLIKREQKAIHEFLADQFALRKTDTWEYAELLLMQAFNTQQRLINPFFHNQIKRRIAMITNPKKTSHRYLRKLLVLPITATIVVLFAFKYKNKGTEPVIRDHVENHFADSIPKLNPQIFVRPPSRESPTDDQLKKWSDAKMYGVWVDGKRVSNSELSHYKPSDFAFYLVSKLAKNARNYGEHYYQVDLMTKNEYDKMYPYEWTTPSKLLPADTSHPLIVIDGRKRPELTINKLDNVVSPNDIIYIVVLKDKSATEKYGAAGRNGVIIITTKNAPAKQRVQPDLGVKDVSGEKTDPVMVSDAVAADDNVVFEKVETAPSFPGGASEWTKYAERNLNAEVPVVNKARIGTYTVPVRFIVYANGYVHNVQALSDHGWGMEQEAIRLITQGPNWIPAVQNGHKVNAYKKVLLTFVVASDKELPVTRSSSLEETVVIGYLKPVQFSGSSSSNAAGSVYHPTQYDNKISVNELKKTSPMKLMGLPEEATLSSFLFTIDAAKDVTSIPNTGKDFNETIVKLINTTSAGHMITMEDVTIVWNGKKQKIPARFYYITD